MSAESIARTMPELERHLFCDVPGPDRLFPHFHPIVRTNQPWYLDLSQFLVDALDVLPERLLYLDSDTYAIEPVTDLWELLEQFDMAAAHAPGRQTAPTVDRLPSAYPEFNIGVIALRNNATVRQLWRDVLRRLREHFDIYGNNDQAPLREALWHNRRVRLAVLPPEYNCRFNFGTFVTGRVRILHGRGDFAQVAASINAQTGMRTWQP